MGYLSEGSYETTLTFYQIFGIERSETCKDPQRHMEIILLICHKFR
jgi:hypothetical protein